MSDRDRPDAYEKLTLEHPALGLLADTLRATRGPAAPEDIAKLLGHALTATGYRLVPAEPRSALVRVSPEILTQLLTRGSEPVVVLGVVAQEDGTHDMVLRSIDRDLTRLERYRDALTVIAGPEDCGYWIEVYRAAGGGYDGLQAIAEEALRDAR